MLVCFDKLPFLVISIIIHLILLYNFSTVPGLAQKQAKISVLTVSLKAESNPVNVPNKVVTSDNNLLLDSSTTGSSEKLVITDKPKVQSENPTKRIWIPLKYYRPTEALDARAVPIDDWDIDLSQIPKDVIFVMTFTVWISETGTIDFIEFQNAADEPSWMKNVRANLAQTRMQPATFEGLPVPSTMTVEVSLDAMY